MFKAWGSLRAELSTVTRDVCQFCCAGVYSLHLMFDRMHLCFHSQNAENGDEEDGHRMTRPDALISLDAEADVSARRRKPTLVRSEMLFFSFSSTNIETFLRQETFTGEEAEALKIKSFLVKNASKLCLKQEQMGSENIILFSLWMKIIFLTHFPSSKT